MEAFRFLLAKSGCNPSLRIGKIWVPHALRIGRISVCPAPPPHINFLISPVYMCPVSISELFQGFLIISIWQNLGAPLEDWPNLGTCSDEWQNLCTPSPKPTPPSSNVF